MIQFIVGLLVGTVIGTLVTLNNQKDISPAANKMKQVLDVNKDTQVNLEDVKKEIAQVKKKVTRKKAK